jgi:hypothetical protein
MFRGSWLQLRRGGSSTASGADSQASASTQPTVRRLDFRAASRRLATGSEILGHGRADTALGRFLKARRGQSPPSSHSVKEAYGTTPVPRVFSPTPAATLSCARELRDFTHPLPQVIPCEGRSSSTSAGCMAWMRPPLRRYGRPPRMATTRPRTHTSCVSMQISCSIRIFTLSPEALPIAMGLGRWTTDQTFFQHYNAPVTLLTQSLPPDSIAKHGQQLLRWGWDPIPPPNVTTTEYEAPFGFWIGKTIPRLERISKFNDGKYSVARKHITHGDLMGLISSARSS